MLPLHFNRPVVIIGMHRSGTSLVAKVLHEAGINMGVERDHNEESLPFLSINQKMMSESGNSWIDPLKNDAQYHSPELALSMYVNHFKIDPNDYALGGKPRSWYLKFAHNMPWGFKDPRNTFTLKAWLELFPNAKVIHVTRHPAAVADSLARRNEIDGEVHDERLNDLQFNLNLWKVYVDEAMKQMDSIPAGRKRTIQYERLLQGGKELTDLGRFVGADLVAGFAARVHPDRANHHPDLDLSSVAEEMKILGYTDN